MRNIAINGLFYTRRIDGLYRYNNEIIHAIDKIGKFENVCLIVPEHTKTLPMLNNISIIKYGKQKGRVWDQTAFGYYVWKHNMLSLNMCNTTVLWNPGITCIHDLLYKDMAGSFNTIKGKLAVLWSQLNYWVIARSKLPIITVSEFSKRRICDTYRVDENRVHVAYSAWQHIKKVEPDESIFTKYPQLANGSYCFTLASMSNYKNFVWICKEAEVNPDIIFVIAGGAVGSSTYSENLFNLKNILLLGYVTDAQISALIRNSCAFLFPSLYEGFGLPPLEAIALGCRAIVSSSACLPEIYENCVEFINPNIFDYNLSDILKRPTKNCSELLNKYSWEKSANVIIDVLRSVS